MDSQTGCGWLEMNNLWNKYSFPSSFKGFIDSTQHRYDIEKKALCISDEASQVWLGSLLHRSQAAGFDCKVCDNSEVLALSQGSFLWRRVRYNELKHLISSNYDIAKLGDIYLILDPMIIAECISANGCAEFIEQVIRDYKLNVRVVLEDAYDTSEDQLMRLVRVCELSGVKRICFEDRASKFTPRGVEQFLSMASNLASGQAIQFEFLFSGSSAYVVENSIKAILSGVQFIHTSVNYLSRGQEATSLMRMFEEFNSSQGFLDWHLIEGYLLSLLQGPNTTSEVQEPQNNIALLDFVKPIDTVLPVAKQPKVDQIDKQDREVSLRFDVSANDWHVRMLITVGDREEDLGERVHHYFLLLLAREYCEQYKQLKSRAAEVDPLLVGWVEREWLHQAIGDNEAQFNVKLCRAKKQVEQAVHRMGIPGYSLLNTRPGAVRLNCGSIRVYQGSRVEFEIEGYQLVESSLWQLRKA